MRRFNLDLKISHKGFILVLVPLVFELVFLIQYILPWHPVASGKVRVAAEVPVNTSILSDVPAVVFVLNAVYLVAIEPRTSNVELGEVVPTPTWP